MKLIKRIINGTVLSMFIFFSISFLTVLFQLPPFKETRDETEIGFPFVYYKEFFVDFDRYHGWFGNQFIIDCLIVWILTVGIYLIIKRNK